MPILTDILMLAGGGSSATKNVEYIAVGTSIGLHIFKFDPNTNSLTQTASYNFQDQGITEKTAMAGTWMANTQVFAVATCFSDMSENTRVTTFRNAAAGSLSYHSTAIYESTSAKPENSLAKSSSLYEGEEIGFDYGLIQWSNPNRNSYGYVNVQNTSGNIYNFKVDVLPNYQRIVGLSIVDNLVYWSNNNLQFCIGSDITGAPSVSNNYGSMEQILTAVSRPGLANSANDIIIGLYSGGLYAIRHANRTSINRITSFGYSPESPVSLDMSADCRYIATGNTSSRLDIIRHIESNGNMSRVTQLQFQSYMNANTDIQAVKYNNAYANSGNLLLYVADYSATNTSTGNAHSNLMVFSCNTTGHATLLASYNMRYFSPFVSVPIVKILDIISVPPQ